LGIKVGYFLFAGRMGFQHKKDLYGNLTLENLNGIGNSELLFRIIIYLGWPQLELPLRKRLWNYYISVFSFLAFHKIEF
jgi:hypothetical protein